jgi:hypothetical protein
MGEPKVKSYSGNLLLSLNSAAEEFNSQEFKPRFIGVLSCYVSREIWEHAIAATKNQLQEELRKDGGAK